MSSKTVPAPAPIGFGEACSRFRRWCAAEPLQTALLAGCLAVLVVFYFFVHIWVNGVQTTYVWALHGWGEKAGEQFHGRFVLPVSLSLVWLRRARYAAAPKSQSNWGLLWLAIGVACFVIGARCLQPRFALLALPFIFYGATLFLWGRHVARLALFPCAFLLFMIPVPSMEQSTFRLQFLVTGTVEFLTKLVGMSVQAVGTTLTARDGSFNFEIAEGCSGIRSLSAMSMLTAVYVHLTQDRFWKKAVIFCASLLFAIFGNIGRIFIVVLVARYISPDLASGLVHDYSAFLIFPVAVMGMTAFSKLVNVDWQKISGSAMSPAAKPIADFTEEENKPAAKPGGPISYDY